MFYRYRGHVDLIPVSTVTETILHAGILWIVLPQRGMVWQHQIFFSREWECHRYG